MDEPCPCGSGAAYAACCGPWHAGADAPTAEALMRSRYCAFVRRDAAYLARTSHPMQRARIDGRALRAALALAWCGLEVVEARGGPGDDQGLVHFRARWRDAAGEHVHEERSRFSRAGGCWVYRDDRG